MEEKEEIVNLFDDNEQPADTAQAVEQEVAQAATFEVPEKFKGKTFEDVVESYVNLEKESGRRANEIGELRKLTDEILRQQVAQPVHQQAPVQEPINEVGFDDFVENPADAVESALANSPRLRRLEESLMEQSRQASHKALLARHQDADEVVGSSEFLAWVNESPGRLRMLQEAHINHDVDIASDLLDTYKATQKIATEQAIEERDAKAAHQLKEATTEKGGVPYTTKKIYPRKDLIRLRIENPAEWQRRSEEFKLAYAEGRVK